MKDLFETLMGLEHQRRRKSPSRRHQSHNLEAACELATERLSESWDCDLERAMGHSRDSILEDFDYDRDHEGATEDEGDESRGEIRFEE